MIYISNSKPSFTPSSSPNLSDSTSLEAPCSAESGAMPDRRPYRGQAQDKEAVRAFLAQPLDLGYRRLLPNRLALAPLAGFTDQFFREICQEYGAGLGVTELASARSLRFQGNLGKTYRYLATSPREGRTSLQLFGEEAADFRQALHLILQDSRLTQPPQNMEMPEPGRETEGQKTITFKDPAGLKAQKGDVFFKPFMIDINMGCPAPKVQKTGSGAALMKDIPRAKAIVRETVQTLHEYYEETGFPCPVSVKYRLGPTEGNICVEEFTEAMTEAGAAFLAIHARTTEAGFSGRAAWEKVAGCRKWTQLPIYINGDIRDLASAGEALVASACDGVMIGRAAVHDPWLFASLLDPDFVVTGALRKKLMIRHLEGLLTVKEERVAVREFRSVLTVYLKGTSQAKRARASLMEISEAKALKAAIEALPLEE